MDVESSHNQFKGTVRQLPGGNEENHATLHPG
jgi:hypothetical protein